KFHTDTGKYEKVGVATDEKGNQIEGYGMPTDSKNRPDLLALRDTRTGRVDPQTNVAKIWTVTFGNRTRPRRGRVDSQDRLWFAAFGTGHIGLLDPECEECCSHL